MSHSAQPKPRQVNILGTRGIPAKHGGFETFAEHLAVYLVSCGWNVNVYCQDDGKTFKDGHNDSWNGIKRTHFKPGSEGSVGTILFDLKCTLHVLNEPGTDLVLGYNTALFVLLQRIKGRRVIMNMDSIEWKRSKWGLGAKMWFFFNEIIGANLSSTLIADHPEIQRHVSKRSFKKPVMIPYGSEVISASDVDSTIPKRFGLEPKRYFISVARSEPENSILELVQAANKLPYGYKAIFLGSFEASNPYHREVLAAASDKVVLPGPIYDKSVVQSLRYHAYAYLHGHQVGGTNPSLVESLGTKNAVLANDNPFNRWTAGNEQFFFSTSTDAAERMLEMCRNPDLVERASVAAANRHFSNFQWNKILKSYEEVLLLSE